MKRTTSLLTNSTIFFLSALISYSARLLTSIIVARSLGPEGKGAYVLVLTTSALLLLLTNLGLNSSITYLTASKRYESKDLFSFALISALLISAFTVVLVYFIYQLDIFRVVLSGVAGTYGFVILLVYPFSLLSGFAGAILLGKQRMLEYNLFDITRSLSNLIFQLFSSLMALGVLGAIAAWSISNIASLFLIIFLLRKDLRVFTKHLKEITRMASIYGIKSYMANLLTFFNYRIDTFIVNFYSGVNAVGIYSASVSTAEVIWYIPNSISSALFPKVSSLDNESANHLTTQLCRIVTLVTIPIILLFGVIGIYLIPILYGPEFRQAIIPFLVLLPGIFSISLSKIISADLSGRGRPEFATVTSIITVIITIVLDFLLIPRYDIIGAATASTIAYFISAVLLVHWLSKEANVSWEFVLIPKYADWMMVKSLGKGYLEKLQSRISGPA